MALTLQQQQEIKHVVEQYAEKQSLPQTYITDALRWFTPLIENICSHQKSASKTVLVGINGCQGSGKSTLCALLVEIFNEVFKLKSIGFSIDDFYYSKAHRAALSDTVHPLLKTRGVPGSHDTKLLHTVVKQLLVGESTLIPVFDKSIDDLLPMSEWTKVHSSLDVVVFEGWCVGIEHQQEDALVAAVNDLESAQDANGIWRKYVNNALKTEYQQVFSLIDYLVMLKAPSFNQVFKWRWEQEQALVKRLANIEQSKLTGIMSEKEVHQFIQFYQRLTEHALDTLHLKSNCTFSLNKKRSIQTCHYR